MDTMNRIYNGKSWKANSTVFDKNSFFHAAFGTRANVDEPYLDQRVKYRRSRWMNFLNYFEGEVMPQPLTDVLKKCLSANEKHKDASVEDQEHLESYVSDIVKAEHDVTIEEILILATLDNVKVVLFKDEDQEPTVIISSDRQLLGGYPNTEKPKGEVVLHKKGNIFSRMNPLVENLVPKSTKNENKVADVKSAEESMKGAPAKESTGQLGSGLIKYNKGGSAGSEGVQFQVGLISVFFLNALQKLENWQLSTENNAAGKFDDVVMEWPEGATLLQAKHKQAKTKKITFAELVSTNSKNDDFSIPKYFLSYQDIKKTFKIKELIICTNASVDGNAKKFLKPQNVDNKSLLYYENCDIKCYTFDDKILLQLKEHVTSYYENNFQNKGVDKSTITDENIKDFLGHLQLFFNYPPGNDIGKVTEKMLSQMQLLENIYVDVTPLDIYTKLLNWFQQKNGVCINDLYSKCIFSEIWRDKYWHKLEKYKIFFQCNDLDFGKSTRLLHFTVEGACLLQEMKILHDLKDDRTKILLVGSDSGAEKQKRVMEAFNIPQYTILVLVWPNVIEEREVNDASIKLREILDRFGYKKVVLVADCNNRIPELVGLNYDVKESVTFNDLSEDSRERLLEKENIIFQGNETNLKELVAKQVTEDYAKFLSNEELEKLVRAKKIKVGAAVLELDEDIREFYVKRKLKRVIKNIDGTARSVKEIFPEELICEMNERAVLISDDAGTGKSTVLTNLAVAIKKKYPHLWVFRIDLNNYTRILKDYLKYKRKTINILTFLNSKHSTKLTNQLERAVFSMNEKIVLMLDGFDEIGPDYTQLVLSLLSRSREQNFAKVIVTTRPHMVLELKRKLQAEPFILEPFTEQDQIDFLSGFWKRNLFVDNTERGKCEEYAKALIEKMSNWGPQFHRGHRHFAAIPLHVRMLAEIFQENQSKMSNDWKGCREYLAENGVEPRLPENMNVTSLYKMFIEKKRSVFFDKENPSGRTGANQALIDHSKECLKYHKSLALELILEKSQCELFSCYCRQIPVNFKTNIVKMGIVRKVNNKFYFVHRTFAEYFVAESLIEELQLPNENVEFQKFFIEDVLLGTELDGISVFFDSFLQQVKTVARASYKITSFDEDKCKLLMDVVGSGQLAIFQLILKYVDVIFFTKTPTDSIQFFKTFPIGENIAEYSNILNILQQNVLDATSTDETFLGQAATGGHLEMVKFLVEQGADVNIGKFKPLHLAVANGHLKVARFLVEQGADIKAERYCTLLHYIISRNDTAMVTYLLDRILQSYSLNVDDPIIPYMAAYLGRLDVLEMLFKEGLDVNSTVDNDETVIFGAVRGQQLETIRYLVQHGCDINSRCHERNTALHLISGYRVNAHSAVYTSNAYESLKRTAECLLELGIDVNATNFYLSSALHIAVEANNFELIKLLVNCKADVDMRNLTGVTALHLASQNLQGNIVRFLVKHGANINSKDIHTSNTALHLAIGPDSGLIDSRNLGLYLDYSQNLDIAKFLIESGGDVNTKNNVGCTILHLAVETGQLDFIILFVKSRIDVNVRDNEGRTALHMAVLGGYTDIVEFLVRHNADSNIQDNDGYTALHYALSFKFDIGKFFKLRYSYKYDILQLVIENDGDVNFRSNDGSTALHLAIRGGKFDAVVLLVESKVDVNIRDSEGRTALHLAVLEGYFNMIEFLLKNGADITITDNYGCTVLHMVVNRRVFVDLPTSAKFTHAAIYLNFIITRCNKIINIKNKTGCTALYLAALKGNLKVVKSLVGNDADINNQNDEGCTALHAAAGENLVEIIKFLLEKDVDVVIRDKKGRTPLHLAAEKNAFKVVVLLVKFGVDVNTRDEIGNTALHTAISNGNFNIAEYLIQAGVDIRVKNHRGYTALHLAAKADSVEKAELDDFTSAEETKNNEMECTISFENSTDTDNSDSDATDKFIERSNVDIVKTLLARFNEAVNIKDELGRTPLHLAVLKGNLEIVEVLLKHNVNFNIEDDSGRSALQLAVDDGKLDIAKLLAGYDRDINNEQNAVLRLHLVAERGDLDTIVFFAELGTDVNVRDKEGYTSLQLALNGGYLKVAKYLIEKGADATGIDDYEPSVLHLAVASNDLDITVFFVKYCTNVSITDQDGNTALHIAVRKSSLNIVEFLVASGIDVNAKNSDGQTALHIASDRAFDTQSMVYKLCLNAFPNFVEENSFGLIELLVNSGADVTLKDSNGNTALHLATKNNQTDIAKFLLKSGASINSKNREGFTALCLAIQQYFFLSNTAYEYKQLDYIKFLIASGGDVDIKNSDGWTIFHLAAQMGALDIIKHLLVEYDTDVNITEKRGRTALHLAAIYNHTDIVKYLVQHNADSNIRDKDGYTVLHYLVNGKLRANSCDAIKLLIKNTRDVNLKTNDGRTALHLAICRGNLNDVTLLVESEIDINIRDAEGSTGLHLAIREDRFDIVEYLLKNNNQIVDAGITDNVGCTPLHLAAEKNAFKVVVLLVEFGVDVDARDEMGDTALHKAVSKGHFNIAEYLAEAGADIRIRNNSGYTAVHLAAKERQCSATQTNLINLWREIQLKCLGIILDDNSEQSNASIESSNMGIVKTFLERCNEAVDIRDKLGRTALHLAVLEDDLKVVEMLLKYNADVNIKDTSGKSALQLAVDGGKPDIAKLLATYGGDING